MEKINKTALSADDDKQIVLEDGIRTLAIGHRATQFFLKKISHNISESDKIDDVIAEKNDDVIAKKNDDVIAEKNDDVIF